MSPIVVWKCGVCGGDAHSGMECLMSGPPICEGCRAEGKTATDVKEIQPGQPKDGADWDPLIRPR
jgi:hypothetical protein